MALLRPPAAFQASLRIGNSVIATAALIALLHYGRDFFVTLIVSAVLAFLFDPAVVLVMKLRVPRAAATAIVIALAIAATYLLGLAAWSQLSNVAEDLPAYATRLTEVWTKANDRLDQIEKQGVEMVVPKSLRDQSQQIQDKPQQVLKSRRRHATPVPQPSPTPPAVQDVRIHNDPQPLIATIYGYVAGYLHVLLMASFVPFLVYFMLSWRDHINRGILRLFHGEQRYLVGKTWSGIGDSTRAYVLGNFLLWVFLSSLSAIVFFFFGIPYWLAVGPISGFFSLLPYVGLPLSVVPPVLAAIAIPNRFTVILTIMIVTAVLHFIAMNVLYPKIIGRRVRLNPLVVTVALMFWGLVWGAIGLLLAVPMTAAIKTVCDNVESLEPYGKLLGDEPI